MPLRLNNYDLTDIRTFTPEYPNGIDWKEAYIFDGTAFRKVFGDSHVERVFTSINSSGSTADTWGVNASGNLVNLIAGLNSTSACYSPSLKTRLFSSSYNTYLVNDDFTYTKKTGVSTNNYSSPRSITWCEADNAQVRTDGYYTEQLSYSTNHINFSKGANMGFYCSFATYVPWLKKLIAVGQDYSYANAVIKCGNSISTLTTVLSGQYRPVKAIFYTDTHVYAIGFDILRSTDGVNWTRVYNNTNQYVYSIDRMGWDKDNNILVCNAGTNTYTIRSNNGGASFYPQTNSGVLTGDYMIGYDNLNKKWLLGGNSSSSRYIYSSSDGITWSIKYSGNYGANMIVQC